MRKILILPLVSALVLILPSCNKQEPVSARVVSFNLSLSYTSAAGATKADTSSPKVEDDGAAACVNRYIVEVYSVTDTAFYARTVKTVPAGTLNTTVDLKLIPNQDYFFLFWADCSNDGADLYHDTMAEGDHGLRKVAIKGEYVGNIDARDAFCQRQTLHIDENGWKQDATLYRPFAQINVITNDLKDIYQDYMLPSRIKLQTTARTNFDVLLNKSFGAKSEISFEAAPYYETYRKEELSSQRGARGCWTLAMDYILTSGQEREVSDPLTLTLTVNGSEIVRTIPNVEVCRNWRTNICGTLIVQGGKYEIIVDPFFEGTLE